MGNKDKSMSKSDIETAMAYDDMVEEYMNKKVVKTSFDGGKYSIRLDEHTGKLDVLRHDEVWLGEGDNYIPGSKMLIGIMYEVSKLRKLLSDVAYDFDPDKGQLSPSCGPEMLAKIKEYEEHFNVDLRYVEDINE